jgi:ABC-type transporter Mla MlaB component
MESLENTLENKEADLSMTLNEPSMADDMRQQFEAEKKISGTLMSIRLSEDGLIFRDEPDTETEANDTRLSGVYCQGVQYYDLRGVKHINNTGMAILIDLLKSLLEMGVEVQFVNVDEKIKNRIRELGLEKILLRSSDNQA